MPALSKKQQKFFGIVRSIQKGEQAPTTPETAKAAADMKKSDVKKFASTKHKGLPEKKVTKEGYGNPNVGPALKVARLIDKTKPGPRSKRTKISQYLKRREMEGDKKKYAAIGEGSLHKWFKGSKSKDGKGGWVNVVTGGTCASDEPGEGTPKCVSSAKRASMSKSERLSAARRKKKADPGQQQKSGAAKPTYVSTDSPRKKKMKEEVQLTEVKDKKGKGSGSKDACYHKVKSRYSVWPSAYASGALVKCRKVGAANWGNSSKKEEFEPTSISFQQFQEKCWKGYEKKGMKTMFGKRYPNCVKKEEVETEGMAYGITRGSGKPSGQMAAFGKKKKENPYSLKNKLKMVIKSVAEKERARAGVTKEGYKGTMDMSKSHPEAKKKVEDNIEKHFGTKKVPGGKMGVKEEVISERQKTNQGHRQSEEQHRSNYGKASIRNVRATGKGGNAADPAERLVAMDARHKAHKEKRGVKTKGVKEELNIVEDDMKGMSVKSGHKRPTKSGAGMTQKGVEAYRRKNPGSKLKTAVTTEPSKLKKGSKAANRRKSYCARSAGQMKKFPKAAKDPDSRLRQARRRWNC